MTRYGMPARQATQFAGTTDDLLALLSRSRPQRSAVADSTASTVIRVNPLRAEQGPGAAVLKVARGLSGAEELRTQRRMLAEIAIHPGLDEEWRELLPRTLAFDERTDATVSVESYRPGVDLAEVLARHPNRVEELTAVALSAIAPLHRSTARFVIVDNVCLVRQWVVDPMSDLTHVCRQLDPGLVSELERLETMLGQALVGRRMAVSWTHGDYTPANVRMAAPQGPVNGIVGWGRAEEGRPALIDEYLMILTAGCQVERADVGAVVSERLRAGGLSDSERNALRVTRDRSGAETDDHQHIDERVAILLAWLHHAASLWRNRDTQPNHQVWWEINVAPVLEAVAALHDLDASSGAPATPQAMHR